MGHKNDAPFSSLDVVQKAILAVFVADHGPIEQSLADELASAVAMDCTMGPFPNEYEIEALVMGISWMGDPSAKNFVDTTYDEIAEELEPEIGGSDCPEWVAQKFPRTSALIESWF